MQRKYRDLDQRVRALLLQLGDAGGVDRCHEALLADGVSASRATVGRAVMRVRETMQFEALTQDLLDADGAAHPGRGEPSSGDSYLHAMERALGDFCVKLSAVAKDMRVTTAQELLIITKCMSNMVKALIDAQQVLDALQAIETKKAENRKQLVDRAREQLAYNIESRKRLRSFRRAIKKANESDQRDRKRVN